MFGGVVNGQFLEADQEGYFQFHDFCLEFRFYPESIHPALLSENLGKH